MMPHSQKFLFVGVLLLSVFFVHRDFSQYAKAPSDYAREAANASLPSVFLPETPPSEAFIPGPKGGELIEHPSLDSAVDIRPAPFVPSGGDLTVPRIEASVALVADLSSGEQYYNFHGEKRWPIASISKLMTAAVVLENIGTEQMITISERDIEPETAVRMVNPGERYSAHDLLRIMLLASSNEAADAFANFYGKPEFIDRMNELAEVWGLRDTFFADPTGLSPANQSTAADLVLMARALYNRYPEVFRITREPRIAVTERTSGTDKAIQNINLFSGRDDFLGGKTGYTDQSQGNLLSLFSHDGRTVVLVVFGTADRFGETEKLNRWFKNAFSASR